MTALADCDWSHFQSSKIELHIALECFNMNLTIFLDKLALLKTFKPVKAYDPWMDSALIGLRRKRDAALRRYLRTKVDRHNDEYARLHDEYNPRNEEARNGFMQTRIAHVLDSNSNGVWRELCNLDLLPQECEELHGIIPDTLNFHFASVSTTDARVSDECFDVNSKASKNGFRFSEVDFNDVVLAVTHFSPQASGIDGNSQSIVAKELPFLGPYIVRIINAFLTTGIFPEPWTDALFVALKKWQHYLPLQIFDQ